LATTESKITHCIQNTQLAVNILGKSTCQIKILHENQLELLTTHFIIQVLYEEVLFAGVTNFGDPVKMGIPHDFVATHTCNECCWIVHVLCRLCVLHNVVCDHVLCSYVSSYSPPCVCTSALIIWVLKLVGISASRRQVHLELSPTKQ